MAALFGAQQAASSGDLFGTGTPDPNQIIQQQGAVNIETAIAQALLNQQSQVTPFGSTSFQQLPGINIPGIEQQIPQFQRTETLSPLGQEQFDTQQRIGGQLSGLAESNIANVAAAQASPFSFEGLAQIPQSAEAFAEQGRSAEQSSFDRALGLLNPEFARQENALNVRLSERGLPLGSEAAQNIIDPFERRRSEALTAAAFEAQGAGRAEQDRILNQLFASRQQGTQERAFTRGLPINEIATLLGTSPGIQIPQFNQFTPTDIGGTDVIGANLGLAEINRRGRSDLLSGLFGLGSAGIAASDIRVKENIKPYGNYNGHNVYSFNYIWDDVPRIGVMAQEIEKVIPEAVIEIGGVKHVNYRMI